MISQMALNKSPNPTKTPKPRCFQGQFSNQASHLDRDCVAVQTSRPFDFMIPSVVVSSRSYFGLTCCPECVSLCQCVSRREGERGREGVSVCLTALRARLAVSAVSVWLGSVLCFTASNLYSVLLFLRCSVLSSLFVSLALISILSFSLSSLLLSLSLCPFLPLYSASFLFAHFLSFFPNIVSFVVAHLSNISPTSPPASPPLPKSLCEALWFPVLPGLLCWAECQLSGLERWREPSSSQNPGTHSISLSLSLALIDTVKGPGTGNMSLGIIQRESTAYGSARADEKRRGEKEESGGREIHSNLCQAS